MRVSIRARILGEQQPLSEAALRSPDLERSYGEEGITTATGVRSTLLASSLQAVRECGLFERYAAALPSRYHERVLHTLAPVWLPLDVAMEHYRAMDTLELHDGEIIAIGRTVGDRLQGTYLSTLARGAKQARLSPWALSSKLDRVWSRVFEGGGIGVEKLGPKDAQVALRRLPLLQFRHFRIGWRGVMLTFLESVTSRGFARELPERSDSDGVDFVVSWV